MNKTQELKTMHSDPGIALLTNLFLCRKDVHAIQIQRQGQYIYQPVYELITAEVLNRHLLGEITIGIYPGQQETKWICIDIDERNTAEVTEIINRVQLLELAPAVEDSGKKGFHIWIFFKQVIPNTKAIAIGRALSNRHEVFPKQRFVPKGKLGNLIKLPLGIHQESGRRCYFLDQDFVPYKNQYAYLQGVKTCDGEWLWQQLCQSKSKSNTHIKTRQTTIKLKPCIKKLLQTAVEQGRRNRAAHILACEYRGMGFSLKETKAALSVWNLRNKPPLSDFELEVVLKSAFAKQYAYGCHKDGPLRQVVECLGGENCMYYKELNTARGG